MMEQDDENLSDKEMYARNVPAIGVKQTYSFSSIECLKF